MKQRIHIVLASALLVLGCAEKTANPPATAAPAVQDKHSYARPAEARVEHVSLDLTPDFQSRRISGKAKLAIRRAPGADSIILDIRDLTIERVSDAGGDSLDFRIGASDPIMGAPLVIELPARGDTIVIEYETSPTAAAV